MFKSLQTFTLLVLLAGVLCSCEKKIVEIIPVLQVEQDLSIAGAKNIQHFAFPTAQVGYAADDSPYIYKTTNGGQTWVKVTVGAGGNCKGLEFFDSLNGMCLMGNSLYVTENGGQSWTLRANGQFIGLTADGKAVTGSCGSHTCEVQVSTNKGKSFQRAGQIRIDGDFLFSRVTGSKLYIAGHRISYERNIYGLDLNSRQENYIYLSGSTAYDKPTDVFENESLQITVGNRGQIREGEYSYRRTYFAHTYDYYSVDGWHDLAIAVGKKTISYNRDFGNETNWSEILDTNGSSFKQTFYRIRFIGQSEFYISGENGLLWRAKI